MDQRTLGRTGVHVSPLCLGAMMLGAWGEPDHDAGIRIIHRALDAGINFIDTADVYSQGESEEIVGKALSGGRRESVVLATKLHGAMGEDLNQAGNSRRWIIREVESSLKRLQTDWIDLYQVHRWDPWTDHEETLGALSDLGTRSWRPGRPSTPPTPGGRTPRWPQRPAADSTPLGARTCSSMTRPVARRRAEDTAGRE